MCSPGSNSGGDQKVLDIMQSEALGLSLRGKHREATQIMEEVVARRRDILGDRHADTVDSIRGLEFCSVRKAMADAAFCVNHVHASMFVWAASLSLLLCAAFMKK